MIKIVISGFYGFGNIGDEAILQAIVEQFRNKNKDIDVTVLSADPENTARIYNVRAVDRIKLFDIFNAIRKSDALISGGGSLLQDVTSKRSIWYYTGIILMALMLGKPVYAFAQGIGPIHNKFNKLLSGYVMRKARYISVRDSLSKDELVKLGVNRSVECTADPALMLQPVSEQRGMEILYKEVGINKGENPIIGFYIRVWKSNANALNIFAQVADRLVDDIKANIVFVPFHHGIDLITAKGIVARMKNPAGIITGNYLPSEIMSITGLMDLCVSVRLHGIILSTKMGVPAVAISYDPKVDSYMNMLGMQPISDYQSLQQEDLYTSIIRAWDNRKAISENMKEVTQKLQDKAQKGIDKIFDDLCKIKS